MGTLSEWLRLYCLLKFVAELNSYVLLAADPDDFRNIAKKIVPEKLANKLARLATDISVKEKSPDDSDYSDYYYESDEEEPVDNTKEESVNDYNIKDLERSGEDMYGKDWKTRVNFDELVERVKDRLAKELSQKLKQQILYPNYSMYNNLGKIGIQSYTIKPTDDKDSNNGNYYPSLVKTEEPYDYNNFKNNREPNENFENINGHIKINNDYLTNKMYSSKNTGQLVEDKKNLHREENTYGKYEAVVMKPLMNNQGFNVYEIDNSKKKDYIDDDKQSNEVNHEEDNSFFHSKNNKVPTYNIQERPKNKRNKKIHKKYENVNDNAYKYPEKYKSEIKDVESEQDKPNYDERFPKQIKKDRNVFVSANNDKIKPEIYDEFDLTSKRKNDSYEDYVIPKVENRYASDEINTPLNDDRIKKVKQISFERGEKSRFKVQHNFNPQSMKSVKKKTHHTQPDENKKAAEDYAEAIDKSQEIKARTESLWYNYDDNNPKTIRDDRSEDKDMMSSVTTSHKVKAKGTMIPTREHFKMASPNYYISIPTVAEKYDPDEPLPEKDRKKEVIKHFGNPPASINKKVKLI